jgi:5'-3' exonuclease
MKILIDGDVLCYRVAYSYKTEWDNNIGADIKTPLSLSEAKVKLDQLIRDILQEINPYAPFTIYLTGKGNFRNDVAKEAIYKGNRGTTPKPDNLEGLRLHLQFEWMAITSTDEEADDLIAIEATNQVSVIVSTDKDFLQVPGTIFNPTKWEFTKVTPWDGIKAFYTQVLTGDVVDNIKGLVGVGPAKAAKILAGCDSEKALYNACLEAYKGNAPLLLENARLLWLRRSVGQLWQPPV